MSAAVPTEQYAAFARRGQEIATAAVEGITGAFKAYAAAVAPQGPRPVDPQAATAASFDLAEKVLKVQREFTIASIALVKDAGDTATARRLSHALRGSAATVGLTPLAQSLQALESGIARGDDAVTLAAAAEVPLAHLDALAAFGTRDGLA